MWRIMRFDITLTPQEIVRELGSRIAAVRLGRNITRAELSQRSGVAERTLARLENGEGNVRLEAFASVCSALALTGRFETLLPNAEQSPESIYRNERLRKRARPKKKANLVWGDEK